MFRGRVRHVHFVGIGGIGMSGLAEILRTLEFDVTGSDLKPNENTRRLEGLGVRVYIGHARGERRPAPTSSSTRAPSTATTPRSRAPARSRSPSSRAPRCSPS